MIGKIYKIVDNTNGNIYFGSTTMELQDRLNKHIYMYNRFVNRGVKKCTSVQIICNGDYKIELIEEVEPNDMLKRERFYIENNDCVNIMTPLRTQKERSRDWYDKNIELSKERAKQQYLKNKDNEDYKEQARIRNRRYKEKQKQKRLNDNQDNKDINE